MNVRVEPVVEAGTERGGEDLLLSFTAEHEGDTPPVDEDVTAELAVADDYECEVTATGGDYDPETNQRYWPNATVKYRTYHYEFEFEGTGEDVLSRTLWHNNEQVTVEQYLRDPDTWSYCHKPGETPRLHCTGKVLVDGNAE